MNINAKIGVGTTIWHPDLVNLYECIIGANCNIAAFVEIGKGVVIGDRVRVGAFSFIPTGVTIEDDCFIGPRVTFTNDLYPPSPREDWGSVVVKRGASLGAGVIVLPGVVIGEGALIGAGSVVTKDVPPYCVCYGVPARVVSGMGVRKEELKS